MPAFFNLRPFMTLVLTLAFSHAIFAMGVKFEEEKNILWNKYQQDVQSLDDLKNQYRQRALKFEDKTMRFSLEKRGTAPENGYPLYIALHGGGQAPSSVNDSQWEHMKIYYRGSVTDGIYVAARGITDNWKLHFEDESYPLYEKLIECAILFDHVDPNRIYFLGFSAGGDGVYQVVSRMPERFAAANMSAGHHNWIDFDNLYNTPFLMQVGEYDSAYKRNHVAVENFMTMTKLQQAYHGGYVHDVFVHENGSHNSWYDNDESRQNHPVMSDPVAWHQSGNRETKSINTNAIDWLNQYTRNPMPEKIVWDLSTSAHKRYYQTGAAMIGKEGYEIKTLAKPNALFYWLDVSDSSSPLYGRIVAEIIKPTNTIKIEEIENIDKLRVLLNPNLLDLSVPVNVQIGEEVIGAINVKEDNKIMQRTLLERSDKNQIYNAEISLTYNDALKKWEMS